MVGTHAGHMFGEIDLAIEMGESIGMAAEVAHGSCTNLPSARK